MEKVKLFSNENLNDGFGIYKIYFNGFEEHCYIGMTTEKAGFKKRSSQHASCIKNLYLGRYGKNKKDFMTDCFPNIRLNIFKNELKNNNDYHLENFRNEYIHGMGSSSRVIAPFGWQLWNYYHRSHGVGDTKYIRMLYFMKKNNLKLTDIIFEIVDYENENNKEEIFKKEHQLIENLNCDTMGFNVSYGVEKIFKDGIYEININKMEKWLNIFRNEEENWFSRWNSIYNIYHELNCFLDAEGIIFWSIIDKKITKEFVLDNIKKSAEENIEEIKNYYPNFEIKKFNKEIGTYFSEYEYKVLFEWFSNNIGTMEETTILFLQNNLFSYKLNEILLFGNYDYVLNRYDENINENCIKEIKKSNFQKWLLSIYFQKNILKTIFSILYELEEKGNW